ncbi:MAG: Rieske (2Fe-2S) protein [Candidatus Omnitrophica bacterium]|nr:Cytochrome b6-f complex iron-sulfur subunit [bacterium]NUN95042.1 Rieske (2Fe-2S) protein [Candidatus Omnitrophota bacterium]
MERRNFFLSTLSLLSAGTVAAMAAAPAALHALSPLLKRAKNNHDWHDLGPVEDLTADQPLKKTIEVVRKDGWQLRRQDQAVYLIPGAGGPVAVSSICPHLGCPVSYSAESAQFECPCHKSFWGPDGKRTSGPSPRDLDPLPTKVEEGRLYCRWVTYQTGIETPVEA